MNRFSTSMAHSFIVEIVAPARQHKGQRVNRHRDFPYRVIEHAERLDARRLLAQHLTTCADRLKHLFLVYKGVERVERRTMGVAPLACSAFVL
ncbi:hypothetical protein [Methylosinus sp. RM1]|uniref:hypothetical protein n=1 Tax=Methylosinus sp. RM1 TaxID=2583817 RepID=UPI00140AEB16|nr:hypothetical protein [Methylosinus sp. RM1]